MPFRSVQDGFGSDLRSRSPSDWVRPLVWNLYRWAMVLAGATVMVVPGAQAASLGMGAPVPATGPWRRSAGHYDGGASEPRFQRVARSGDLESDGGTRWLDLPGTAERRDPVDATCKTPEPSPEMLMDRKAVASEPPERRGREVANGTRATPDAPVAGPEPEGRFRVNGQKYTSPVGSRSEAGVAMSLGAHFSVQLNYARTAQVPMMGYSSDNGILARLRFGF